MTLGNSDIENFVQFVITEYYPENAGDYLKKKKRLLELAKKGRKGAKKQLTKEELTKIRELLDQEIKEVFGTNLPMFQYDQDDLQEEKLPHFRETPNDYPTVKPPKAMNVVDNYFDENALEGKPYKRKIQDSDEDIRANFASK